MDDHRKRNKSEYNKKLYTEKGEQYRQYYHNYYQLHKEEMQSKARERYKERYARDAPNGRPRIDAKKKIPVVYLDDITPPQHSPNNDFGDKNDNTVVAVQ